METPPQIQIGEFKVAFLTDGLWRNDGGCMFGVVPRELWQGTHLADSANRIRLNLTCPLIIRGRDAIVVDTGIGNRLSAVERRIFDHGDGWLLDGLRMLGMEAGDITHVLLSHLHFDHSGGLVRRKPDGGLMPAFPKARIFVQQGELEVARGTTNERLRAAYRHVAECLAPLDRLEAINGDTELIPGVAAKVTGGHTTDHQVAVVRSGDAGLVHLADIVPTRSHMRGPWNQAYDLDAIRTIEQKADYLGRSVASDWWVSYAHDDEVFAARLTRDRGRLQIVESVAVPRELA
jgi:glyoxylase-like metal-dependent hydrolase (beta-lactamase superfamily II)